MIAERPTQTNCQQEPRYPGAETVVCSIRYPHLTSHLAHAECPIEGPHTIAECGRFASEAAS